MSGSPGLTIKHGHTVVVVGLLYCALLASPFILFVALKSFPHKSNGGNEEVVAGAVMASMPWYENSESRMFKTVTRAAVLGAVMAFGALGAMVSFSARIGSRTREMPMGLSDLFAVQTVGAVFALILTLILMGGIVGGSLFPGASGESWFAVIYFHSDFAKLLVWAFIAGFSERAVPQVLDNLVLKLRSKAED